MAGPLCIITGVGDATGSATVRKFISQGYRVAMIARNADRLQALADQHPGTKAYACDLSDLQAFETCLTRIEAEMGVPRVLVHNAVSHSFGRFRELDPLEIERNFRVNTTALLVFARFFADKMAASGGGAILATGNTASHRGVPNYALFAPTKAAQRNLCEALARDLGPEGIHVCYLSVDAAIDVTWLGASDAERPSWLVPPADWPHAREDFFAHPDGIAAEIYHFTHQHRTTWSFETTIRPFTEKW
ncbi:SDR family NAD(P)-dependent oxidoreductase [Leisingera sp. JC1]|uniref:SDR family NAD(P)-dependent oxidoreductase n=1 Tax=Leisingera sp. JC1 TaxID=1855282 RepID=UPI0008039E6E|nr:SDR family NAD(P)-dependent oxidoreductase [Leisingera sp. JC1]OBY25119.1 short-chain dehydrogenase [Leisingera sp. JC1]